MKANATAHSFTPILASKSKALAPGRRAPRPAKARTQSAPSPGKPYAEVVADIAAGTRLEDIAAHLVEFESSPADADPPPPEDHAHLDRMLLDSPGTKPDIASNLATKYDPTGNYGLRFALRELALHLVATPALYDRLTDPRQFKNLVSDLRQFAKARTLDGLALDRTESGKPPQNEPDDFLDALAIVHCILDGEEFREWLEDLARRIELLRLPQDFDPFAIVSQESSHHRRATFLEYFVRPAVEEALATVGEATPAVVANIITRHAARLGRKWKLPPPTQSQHSKKTDSCTGPTPRERVLKRLQDQIASVHPVKK
jgi:hypothetical protein